MWDLQMGGQTNFVMNQDSGLVLNINYVSGGSIVAVVPRYLNSSGL